MAVGVAAEVKNKLSVVDVIGPSVQLKKSGTSYKGLCPFHGEKTPSFYVTPARESWKCFGCSGPTWTARISPVSSWCP